MNDHKDIALVIDMRSKAAFEACSLDKSINFPPETFNEQRFINWAKEVGNIEKDTSICPTPIHAGLIKRRKRFFIYVIPCQSNEYVQKNLK